MTISVIIPAYQGEKYLNLFSLPSLVAQTYQDWEAIVVDDASSDNTQELIESWQAKDRRIKYLRHDYNRGLAASLNTGLKASQGKIIAFLEQDDIWLNNKLARQADILSKKKLTDCRSFLFNETTLKLINIGGGNFSTLAGQRETINKLFPLPENKKYLGIEDGLLAGRLALLTDNQILLAEDINHTNDIMVLVSRHQSSLSGHGHSLTYIQRYQAALDFFDADKSPGLSRLKHSWRLRRQLNILLSFFPAPVQKIIRGLNIISKIRALWRLQKIKNKPTYLAAKKIISNLR